VAASSNAERIRSLSAGIPSDYHQLVSLDDPSTSTQRRSRRSYSLERSMKADQRQAEKKHRRQATALMDLAGSSSMEDSEDGASSRDKLKARFLAEIKERKRQEETAKHLQQNYENLLRRHAEKELTIEQLRLGARVSLVCDPPAASHIETGSVAKPQRALVFNVSKQGRAVTGAAVPQTGLHGLIRSRSDLLQNGQVGSVSNAGTIYSQSDQHGSVDLSTSRLSHAMQFDVTSNKSALSHWGQIDTSTNILASSPTGQVESANNGSTLPHSGHLNSAANGYNNSRHSSINAHQLSDGLVLSQTRQIGKTYLCT